jgi:hypothetical protein
VRGSNLPQGEICIPTLCMSAARESTAEAWPLLLAYPAWNIAMDLLRRAMSLVVCSLVAASERIIYAREEVIAQVSV